MIFAWGGQSTGVSTLASFLPKKSQHWSPSEWIGWISLQSKGLSRVFSNTTVEKHQFFGAQLSSQSNSQDSDAGRDWGQEEKGTTEDEMAGWHHWLDGHEFEWTLGVGDGQGGLALCNSWSRKESDATERLNWTKLRWLNVQAGPRSCEGNREFCPLRYPGPSALHSILPCFSCLFLWHGTMMGPPGSQKNRLTLRGHTTKSSLVPWCQTSLLCNFEAQDTAFLACLNNKRSAYTPPTSADPAPQIYFLEGGEWAQQSLKKLTFLKRKLHANIVLLWCANQTVKKIFPLFGMKCKNQMLEKKGLCVQCKKSKSQLSHSFQTF